MNLEMLLSQLYRQGTILRAEKETRVNGTHVEEIEAIKYDGFKPGPAQMALVMRFRLPILEHLKRTGKIDYAALPTEEARYSPDDTIVRPTPSGYSNTGLKAYWRAGQ